MKGVAYVALGANAQHEVSQSMVGLLKHNKGLATMVLEESLTSPPRGVSTSGQQAHWAKVNAYWWSPFPYTLLLDADTRVKGSLLWGFKLLWAGWEVVVVPSIPPRPNAVLWHLSRTEQDVTLAELGAWHHVMLNTGALYFRKSPRVQRLFEAWREEWLRFKDQDQGALLRALRRSPVKLWLIGSPFNSRDGAVVEHLFGRART